MKKQLLILFIGLFVTGLTSVFGQNPICPTPRAVDTTCLNSDALHPIAGVPYAYSVSVPTPPGAKLYTWFVTQSQTFMSGGAITATVEPQPGPIVLAAGPGYNDPVTGGPTITITWNSFVYDPTQPIFVVIHVKNTASTPDGCVTNNIKVYKIEPMIAFTLDIANVTKAGVTGLYDTPIDRCIHDVVSAAYDPTAPEGVLYDFGKDTLFYIVVAANFDSSWLPSIQLSGVNTEETIESVQWDYTFAFPTPHNMTFVPASDTIYTAEDSVIVQNPTMAVGPAGECIFIRVIIDHTNGTRNWEALWDETISLAVDGITKLSAPTPFGDIHYSSTLPIANILCGQEDDFQFDIAVQTLKPRPDIQGTTPGGGFLPVKP
jgi:hypothetical protein